MAMIDPYSQGYGTGASPPGAGAGLSLEDLINDPEFLSALAKSGYGDMNAQMPEGRHAGGTFVAAHPLEFAAAAGQRIAGGLNQRNLQQAMARILRGQYGESPELKPDPYEG